VADVVAGEGFSEYEEGAEPLLCRILDMDFRELLY
jgi:hypothetical protein